MEDKDGLRIIPGSDRHVIWIPSRRHLKHAVFTIPAQLTGRKRSAALDLKVQAWAPFESVSYLETWNDDNQASVLAWDREAVERVISDQGYQPGQCEIVPEIFMREPISNGIRLIQNDDGVEGQVWKDQFLTASRWWSSTPNAQEWNLFVRSAGQIAPGGDLTAPNPMSPSWLETPWNKGIVHRNLLTQALTNKAFIAAGVAVLGLPCSFFLASWLTYAVKTESIESQISRIEIEGRTVRQERSRAISAIEQAEVLSSLRRFPRQIEIISRTHSLLRPYSIEIAGWDYDEGVLEFGLQSEDDMDATQYIPLFEDNSLFYRVSASTRGDRLVMRMNVSPLHELSP